MKDLSSFRQSYGGSLDESDLDGNPVKQFNKWLEDAISAGFREPNAMTLATSTPEGRPSARIVLLKGFDETGFLFFTHYDGRKGTELESNPHAALVFYWDKLERQVRIEGAVTHTSDEESDHYFGSRSPSSRRAARASRQSTVIADREALERAYTAEAEAFPSRKVPRPPRWGGYRLTPEHIEFWQGGRHRLHDRLRYVREGDAWRVERLMP